MIASQRYFLMSLKTKHDIHDIVHLLLHVKDQQQPDPCHKLSHMSSQARKGCQQEFHKLSLYSRIKGRKPCHVNRRATFGKEPKLLVTTKLLQVLTQWCCTHVEMIHFTQFNSLSFLKHALLWLLSICILMQSIKMQFNQFNSKLQKFVQHSVMVLMNILFLMITM